MFTTSAPSRGRAETQLLLAMAGINALVIVGEVFALLNTSDLEGGMHLSAIVKMRDVRVSVTLYSQPLTRAGK